MQFVGLGYQMRGGEVIDRGRIQVQYFAKPGASVSSLWSRVYRNHAGRGWSKGRSHRNVSAIFRFRLVCFSTEDTSRESQNGQQPSPKNSHHYHASGNPGEDRLKEQPCRRGIEIQKRHVDKSSRYNRHDIKMSVRQMALRSNERRSETATGPLCY